MSEFFTLKIVAPDKVVFEGECRMLSVKGVCGSLSVMKGHIPFVTPTKPCEARVYLPDGTVKSFQAGKGLLSVTKEDTILLL